MAVRIQSRVERIERGQAADQAFGVGPSPAWTLRGVQDAPQHDGEKRQESEEGNAYPGGEQRPPDQTRM